MDAQNLTKHFFYSGGIPQHMLDATGHLVSVGSRSTGAACRQQWAWLQSQMAQVMKAATGKMADTRVASAVLYQELTQLLECNMDKYKVELQSLVPKGQKTMLAEGLKKKKEEKEQEEMEEDQKKEEDEEEEEEEKEEEGAEEVSSKKRPKPDTPSSSSKSPSKRPVRQAAKKLASLPLYNKQDDIDDHDTTRDPDYGKPVVAPVPPVPQKPAGPSLAQLQALQDRISEMERTQFHLTETNKGLIEDKKRQEQQIRALNQEIDKLHADYDGIAIRGQLQDKQLQETLSERDQLRKERDTLIGIKAEHEAHMKLCEQNTRRLEQETAKWQELFIDMTKRMTSPPK